jgi:hypothetical protein
MNQSFLLKYYGKYSMFEQDQMTAEDRQWLIKRINEEIEKRNKSQSGNVGDGKRDHTPGLPPV